MTSTMKRELKSMGKTDADIEAIEEREKVEAKAVKMWGEFRVAPDADRAAQSFCDAFNAYAKAIGAKVKLTHSVGK